MPKPSTSKPLPVLSDTKGVGRTRCALLALAAMGSPLLMWQFAMANLQYGWLFFICFVVSLFLIVWPLLWVESKLACYWRALSSGQIAPSLLQLTRRLFVLPSTSSKSTFFTRYWFWLPVMLSVAVLLFLLVCFASFTILVWDEVIAATLPSFWVFGDLDGMQRVYHYWEAQQRSNWPLLLFWAVVLGVAAWFVLGRNRLRGTFRWLPLLWCCMMLVLIGLFVTASGWIHIDANFIAPAVQHWLQTPNFGLNQWLNVGVVAAQQALICGMAGFGWWALLHHARRQRLSRHLHMSEGNVSSRDLSTPKSYLGFRLLSVLLVFSGFAWLAALLCMQLILASGVDTTALMTDADNASAIMRVAPYLLQVNEPIGQAFAVAFLLLVGGAAFTTFMALFEVVVGLVQNVVFNTSTLVQQPVKGRRFIGMLLLLLILPVTLALLWWRELQEPFSYYVLVTGLPIAGWTIVTLWLGFAKQSRRQRFNDRQQQGTEFDQTDLHEPGIIIWLIRFPLRFVLISMLLIGLGIVQWLLEILRMV